MNFTYILRCGDGSLYAGWTNDIEKRLEAHRSGTGAKYTRGRSPIQLVFLENFDTQSEAMKFEAHIKNLSKNEKETLIASVDLDSRLAEYGLSGLDIDGTYGIPYLANAKKTSEIVRKYEFTFHKRLGQHFLIDDSVPEEMIHAAALSEDDTVLEIGPGIGTLTQYLASSAGQVISIEADKSLLPVLEETLRGYKNVKIINKDFLRVDLCALLEGTVKVVANLPYNITSDAVLKLLKCGKVGDITVMVQKEAAERMMAAAGSKSYCALSLFVQYFAEASIVMEIPPESFMPKPRVDSVVMHLKRKCASSSDMPQQELLFKIIRAAFNERRKTLANALAIAGIAGLSKQEAAACVADAGFPENIRGEKLSLYDFEALAQQLQGLKKAAQGA